MYLYHVLDTETSGFNIKTHDICEIAIITCNGTKIEDIFHKFYSVQEMSAQASEVNGLTLEKLKNFKPFSDPENVKEIKSKLKYYPIWAHNISFDVRFLNKYGVLNGNKENDSLEFLRKKNRNKIDRLPNNKLGTWLNYYNIKVQEHTALGDALGLSKIIMLEGFYLNGY